MFWSKDSNRIDGNICADCHLGIRRALAEARRIKEEKVQYQRNNLKREGYMSVHKSTNKQFDCETVADAIHNREPTFGVTVEAVDASYGRECMVKLHHNSSNSGLSYRFEYVQSGIHNEASETFYPGSDSSKCQAIADQLNNKNSLFSWNQVICKAVVKRGMCTINMSRRNTIKNLFRSSN